MAVVSLCVLNITAISPQDEKLMDNLYNNKYGYDILVSLSMEFKRGNNNFDAIMKILTDLVTSLQQDQQDDKIEHDKQ